jgi:hypothetical protein
MITSLLFIAIGTAGLIALLYRFAIYALPAFIGFAAGSWAMGSGSGVIGGFAFGAVVAGAIFALGQVFYATARSAPLRALILLAFALPAAYAGYSMVLQLAGLGITSTIWRETFAVFAAVIVAGNTVVRLFGQSNSRQIPSS